MDQGLVYVNLRAKLTFIGIAHHILEKVTQVHSLSHVFLLF